jgi:two-component system sensor histidine kinase RegB
MAGSCCQQDSRPIPETAAVDPARIAGIIGDTGLRFECDTLSHPAFLGRAPGGRILHTMSPMNPPVSPLSSAAINLQRLVTVRAIAVAGQGAAVWVAIVHLGLDLPRRPLVLILAALSVLAMASQLRLRWRLPVREGELFAQLVTDVAALTGMLYFSGGATNPFVTLYLLPLAFAAAALPARYAWAMAGLTTVCYTLLLYWHVPLPQTHAGGAHDFGLHVAGMWFGFVLSAVLIAGFAARMSATLRERDRLAAEMREHELREERVIALGTLAAGAAHELGTPLSTMAVLVKDMAAAQPVGEDRLATLRAQLARCKEILGSLSASAGQLRAEGGAARALDEWLEEIVQRWRVVRPGVGVRMHLDGARPAPRVIGEQTLAQAVTNVLNNAADASPQSVEFDARWTADEIVLEIADRGPGLAPEMQGSLGSAPRTTRPGEGLGLGLFLAYTTLSRFGGEVRILNRDGGGALCRIVLPLAALRVSA